MTPMKGTVGRVVAVALWLAWIILAEPGIACVAAQSPASPLTATLTMPTIPPVNQPARLDITVASVRDAAGTTVELILPPGAAVVEGRSLWTLDLQPGAPQTLTTTIRFGRTGQQEVLVRLRRPIDANNAWEGQGALGVTIGEKASQAGFATAPAGEQEPLTPEAGGPSCLGIPAFVGLLAGLFLERQRRRSCDERR